MSSSTDKQEIIRIIACGVFKPALQYLQLEERYPNVQVTFLPSILHLRPYDLKSFLHSEIQSAHKRNEKVICLYGNCFPDIDDFCKENDVIKVPGSYCYEMFLGPKRFQNLINEVTGTYFMEKELIVNFEQHCLVPLELDDEMMRGYCFEHYKKLLYVRQPTDPDLDSQVKDIASFLELSLDVQDADYSFLSATLEGLIKTDSSK